MDGKCGDERKGIHCSRSKSSSITSLGAIIPAQVGRFGNGTNELPGEVLEINST